MDDIDMIYDGFEPLQSIDLWPNQNTRGRLLLHMEMAQALMKPESSYQDWLRRLRFVVEVPHWNTGYDYELIQSNSLEDLSEPYIAISYRWREKKSVVPPVKHHILVQTPGRPGEKFWRPVNAPIDVLQRSFVFARAHGVRKIWIDQECIEQEDEDDVAQAIQSMHVVYRSASTVLAVLNRHATRLADINALEKITKGMEEDQNSLRARIMADPWWKRAWTAQEMGVSSFRQLRFMIGWHESFDIEGTAWTALTELYNQGYDAKVRQIVFREWILRGDQILSLNLLVGGSMELLYSLMSGLAHWHKSGHSSALPVRSRQTEGACYQKDSELISTDVTMKKSMAESVRLLHLKECLKVSDKLAMFGNLGNYHHRIDKNRAVKLQLGFTACALAMALYNGDVSPLFYGLPEQSEHLWIDADRLATWLPHHRSYFEGIGQISGVRFGTNSLPQQSSKALVLDGKLAIKGFMWDISQYREFEYVAEQVRLEENMTLRLQLLLRTLCRLGHHELLAIIVSLWMLRPLRSPAEMAYIIMAIQEWFQQMRPWPAEIFSGSERMVSGEPGELAKAICTEIAAGRPLLLGSCRKGDDELTCLCLGPSDMKQAFSPLSSLSCCFNFSELEHLSGYDQKNQHWSVESTSCRVSQRHQEKLLKHLDGDDRPSPHVIRVREPVTVLLNPFVWAPFAHQDPSPRYRLKISGGDYRWFC